MNLFTYANGTSLVGVDTPSMDSVVVNLWNPNTMQPHSFTALLQDESVTEDQPNEWWWGDAREYPLAFESCHADFHPSKSDART